MNWLKRYGTPLLLSAGGLLYLGMILVVLGIILNVTEVVIAGVMVFVSIAGALGLLVSVLLVAAVRDLWRATR